MKIMLKRKLSQIYNYGTRGFHVYVGDNTYRQNNNTKREIIGFNHNYYMLSTRFIFSYYISWEFEKLRYEINDKNYLNHMEFYL